MQAVAVIGTYPAEMLATADTVVKQLKDLTVRHDGSQILIELEPVSARGEIPA
jgi:hypothetical protein